MIISQTVIFRTCSRGARGFIRGQVALDPIKRDIDHSAPLIEEEIEREIERRKEKRCEYGSDLCSNEFPQFTYMILI